MIRVGKWGVRQKEQAIEPAGGHAGGKPPRARCAGADTPRGSHTLVNAHHRCVDDFNDVMTINLLKRLPLQGHTLDDVRHPASASGLPTRPATVPEHTEAQPDCRPQYHAHQDIHRKSVESITTTPQHCAGAPLHRQPGGRCRHEELERAACMPPIARCVSLSTCSFRLVRQSRFAACPSPALALLPEAKRYRRAPAGAQHQGIPGSSDAAFWTGRSAALPRPPPPLPPPPSPGRQGMQCLCSSLYPQQLPQQRSPWARARSGRRRRARRRHGARSHQTCLSGCRARSASTFWGARSREMPRAPASCAALPPSGCAGGKGECWGEGDEAGGRREAAALQPAAEAPSPPFPPLGSLPPWRPCTPRFAPLQRKDTLLVEYKQLRKSNAFIDRRFGGEWGAAVLSATGGRGLGLAGLLVGPLVGWQVLVACQHGRACPARCLSCVPRLPHLSRPRLPPNKG